MRMKTQPFNIFGLQKAVLREKYIAIQSSIQKLERTQIQKLTLHQKELEKKQQIDPTPSRRRELIKIRAELNEIETRRTVGRSTEPAVDSVKELIR